MLISKSISGDRADNKNKFYLRSYHLHQWGLSGEMEGNVFLFLLPQLPRLWLGGVLAGQPALPHPSSHRDSLDPGERGSCYLLKGVGWVSPPGPWRERILLPS